MGYAQDVKALTSDVAKLTGEINKLHSVLSSTGKDAGGIFKTLKGILGIGGSRGLGSTGANRMIDSLAGFNNPPTNPSSMNSGGGKPPGPTNAGGGTTPNGGGARFSVMSSAMRTDIGLGGAYAIGSGFMGGIKAAAGMLYNAVPDASSVVNRAGSYYQAALRSPGLSRSSLAQSTLGAMRGGVTSIGSDAQVANILAAAGYSPGSRDYLATVRQVRGAATYMGMENAPAAQAIAGLQGGQMGAMLYQYGITTMNPNGTPKSTGDIAKQLYRTMFPMGATPQSVQESIRSGFAGLNMQGLGMSPEMQQIMSQHFVDIAAGKNPDLATQKSPTGNQNPFDPYLRMNTASTDLQQKVEKNTLSGLGAAAGTIETFNRNLGDAVASLAIFKGYLDGLSGNPQGSAIKGGASGLMKAGKKILGGGMMLAGLGLEGLSFGTSTALVVAGGALAFGGGGNPGYGSSFGGRNQPNGKYANGLISFAYGDRDAQGGSWDSTGGVHKGTDFNVKEGTSVIATKDGIVSDKTLSADYGQAVVIDHEGGYSTVYAHLKSKSVAAGTRVFQGQEIGKSGKSGNASGPHLHYEVWKGNNNPVDPASLVGASLPILGGSGTISSSMSINTGNPLAGISSGEGLLGGVVDASKGGTVGGVTYGTGMDYQGKIPPNADINLLDVLKKAGFTGDALTTAYAVAKAESGGRSSAYNPPSNGTGDDSYGLFQINMLGGLGPERLAKTWKSADGKPFKLSGKEDLFDPLTNAKVAYHMSDGGKNWGAWTTYTSGKYQQFLDPKGGGTPGAPGMSTPDHAVGMNTPRSTTGVTATRGDNKIVNFNVYLSDVSEAQALIWARKIEAHLNNKAEIAAMGGK